LLPYLKMKETEKAISVVEFRRLLIELRERGAGVCIRFRPIGEMWYPNFTRIVLVTDTKALLFDEQINKSLTIPDISKVMQFEIDNRFQNYQPNFHYDVQGYMEG
jgi:hypothetical protein